MQFGPNAYRKLESDDYGYSVKPTADGDTLWTETYGGAVDDCLYAVRQTSDGGYVIAGTTDSDGLGDDDVLLIKTDSDGNMWHWTDHP